MSFIQGEITNDGSTTTVVGKITEGSGLASGKANDFLYGEIGTIRRQVPVMMAVAKALENPLPSWFSDIYMGSLNVNIGEDVTFDITNADWNFPALCWMRTDGINPAFAKMSHEELQNNSDIVRMFTALGLDVPSMSMEEIIRHLHLKCENFWLIEGLIETASGAIYKCIFYRPDPLTKGSIFHGDHCFEILSTEIPKEEVMTGALVKITLPKSTITFIK